VRKAEVLRVGERYSRADLRLERRDGMVRLVDLCYVRISRMMS
jgi:hypothetical protein